MDETENEPPKATAEVLTSEQETKGRRLERCVRRAGLPRLEYYVGALAYHLAAAARVPRVVEEVPLHERELARIARILPKLVHGRPAAHLDP